MKTIIERGASWTLEETKMLLALWGQDLVQRQQTNTKRTKEVYEKISEKFNQNGFERTADQVRTRVFNMIAEYRRILKDPNVERIKKCIFFEALHRIYQAKHMDDVKSALDDYEPEYPYSPVSNAAISSEKGDESVSDSEATDSNETVNNSTAVDTSLDAANSSTSGAAAGQGSSANNSEANSNKASHNNNGDSNKANNNNNSKNKDSSTKAGHNPKSMVKRIRLDPEEEDKYVAYVNAEAAAAGLPLPYPDEPVPSSSSSSKNNTNATGSTTSANTSTTTTTTTTTTSSSSSSSSSKQAKTHQLPVVATIGGSTVVASASSASSSSSSSSTHNKQQSLLMPHASTSSSASSGQANSNSSSTGKLTAPKGAPNAPSYININSTKLPIIRTNQLIGHSNGNDSINLNGTTATRLPTTAAIASHQLYQAPVNTFDVTSSALLIDRMFAHLSRESENMREWIALEKERLALERARRQQDTEREVRRERVLIDTLMRFQDQWLSFLARLDPRIMENAQESPPELRIPSKETTNTTTTTTTSTDASQNSAASQPNNNTTATTTLSSANNPASDGGNK